jgi:hypothetical protein
MYWHFVFLETKAYSKKNHDSSDVIFASMLPWPEVLGRERIIAGCDIGRVLYLTGLPCQISLHKNIFIISGRPAWTCHWHYSESETKQHLPKHLLDSTKSSLVLMETGLPPMKITADMEVQRIMSK